MVILTRTYATRVSIVYPTNLLPSKQVLRIISRRKKTLKKRSAFQATMFNLLINLSSCQPSPATLCPPTDLTSDPTNSNLKPSYDFSALPFANDHSESLTTECDLSFLQFSSLNDILFPILLRIALFVPWCVAVGGTIVMFPRHLEFVAFSPGYVKSPRGIYRFKHWADTGMHHVWIFAGFLASIWWIYPAPGLLLVGGVIAQFVNAWHDFTVDRRVPLGEDDRQSMYLVATQYGLPDKLMDIRKTEQGYVISRLDEQQVED
jgi:hypothetical protein